ncbi:MAG: GNAT family N-acetyltransferase, partial [Planctomycetota bacterium]
FGGDAELSVYERPEDVRPFLLAAAEISRQTYQHPLGGGIEDDAHWRSVLAEDAKRGRFIGYVLEGRGRGIAFEHGSLIGSRFWYASSGFLPELARLRPGAVLFNRTIQDLCVRGAEWLDLGFGDTGQKRIYGTHSWEEATVSLYGSRPRARAALTLEFAASLLRRAADVVVPRSVAPRVKKAWRARLVRRS